MRLCYARQAHRPFVGVGELERWINLSQAMHARSDRFPWLNQCPEPLIEEILWNEEDLLGSRVNRVI